ncbi:MAG: DUF4091 domain-containing protein [Clostridia bacterium]|nr:DUF4091 domain-containing protein [Clostridia bacterium]
MNKLQLKQVSSLAKVLPEKINCGSLCKELSCVRGQEISYQIAYRFDGKAGQRGEYRVDVISPWQDALKIYRVGNVPSVLSTYFTRCDDDYITHKSGIFPDPLLPMQNAGVMATAVVWQSLWISVKIPEDFPAGKYTIRVIFTGEDGERLERKLRVTVYPYTLPEQELLFTQWFYCDCIADAHGVPVFSEEHWNLLDQYIALAAEGGINVLLTPVLTPPLDTKIGGERPTVQLVDIQKDGDDYTFDFTRLKRFVDMAKRYGIHYFEINHFFTQWGAEHAPKVIATVDGEKRRIFGWETDACGEEYKSFVRQLIPALIDALGNMGVDEGHILFHVSDEPKLEHLDQYRRVAAWFRPLIERCTQFDALSNLDFYQQGLVQQPVVATNRIEPFLSADVPNLWCYYCCSQAEDVANRFLAMPSYRNRIIGVQMYKFGIYGFLHWGYNFYYGRLSVGKINPYCNTDANIGFPSGDSFSVYPLENGVTPSLRFKVFYEALQDMRLLKLVEEKIGRDAVIAELDRLCEEPLTFSDYPRTEAFFGKLEQFIFSIL